jgi:hypothetical protein
MAVFGCNSNSKFRHGGHWKRKKFTRQAVKIGSHKTARVRMRLSESLEITKQALVDNLRSGAYLVIEGEDGIYTSS